MNKPEGIDKQAPTVELMRAMGKGARAAARELALASTVAKNAALRAAAQALRRSTPVISGGTSTPPLRTTWRYAPKSPG